MLYVGPLQPLTYAATSRGHEHYPCQQLFVSSPFPTITEPGSPFNTHSEGMKHRGQESLKLPFPPLPFSFLLKKHL